MEFFAFSTRFILYPFPHHDVAYLGGKKTKTDQKKKKKFRRRKINNKILFRKHSDGFLMKRHIRF